MTSDATELRPFTDRDREIISFERSWWKYAGAKESEIRSRFDTSGIHYAQVLDHLLNRPEAEEYDAVTVRRLREVRRKVRTTGRQGLAAGS